MSFFCSTFAAKFININNNMENLILTLSDFLVALFAGMTVTGVIFLWLLIAAIGLLVAFFFRIYIAYKLAKDRQRDPLPWVLLSFCFSPILTWIILLIIGDAKQ